MATSAADRLLSFLAQTALTGRVRDLRAAHREAYRLGAALVAPLLARIEGYDWSRRGPRGSMKVLRALWLLLHDLDEESSRSLAETLWIGGKLHLIYARRLVRMTSFTRSDYLPSEVSGVSVFTFKRLPRAPQVAEQVAACLSGVPTEELSGIDRLYVVDETQKRSWGEELRVLGDIVLVWRGT